MGTMKGFADYAKNREERLAKLENKMGFSMSENLQNAYKTNYTPTGNKNDITHFLTRRDSKDAEAERIASLAKVNEEAKARIDKLFSEKVSANKRSSLNPLSSYDRKYMSIAEKNKHDTEKANEYISQNGYLDKNADKETRDNYYANYMKSIGYTDDEIKKALGFGGQVALSEGFLGKVASSVKNAMAPGYEEGAEILANLNAKNQGSKVGNISSNLIGTTLGLALNPGGEFIQGKNLLNVADDLAEGVAGKVAPKFGNSSIGKVATRSVRGAVDGGIGGGIDSFRSDDTKNIVSNIANGALGGALMFGGEKALGEIGGSFRGLKTPFSQFDTKKNTSSTNTLNPLNKVEVVENNPRTNIMVEAMEPEAPKVFDNTVKNLNVKDSKFANDTVLGSDLASPELKKGIIESEMTYNPVTNKSTLENAQKIINNNFNSAYARIMDKNAKIDAEYMAIGQELLKRLQNEGRYDEALNILDRVTKEGSKGGQAIQALSMWRKMTPEGMLAHAQRQINKANSKLPKAKPKIQLTADEVSAIADKMKEVQQLPDGREKDILLSEVNNIINNKIPSSLMDKIDSFRYINMLFNPKTMIKNIGGNVINTGMGSVRDVIGSGIDKIISNKTGIRTTGLPDFGAMGEGFKKGIKETVEDYKKGINTSMDLREASKGNALRDIPLLGKVEDLTSFGLRLGDTPFYEAKANEFIKNYMKLNGIDDISKLPAEVLEEANKAGLEATYQQRTKLGDAVNSFKNHTFKPVSFATKAILPFSQTPSAILDTSLNYTPIGVIRGAKNIYKALSSDNARDILSNQRKGVNQLASGLLGTALIGGGYAGAQSGALTGSLSGDKNMYNLQKQSGLQPYSLRVGDTYNSLEFAQPAVSPVMIGSDISQGNLNPLKSSVNSLLGNSYLSGLQSAIDAAGNAEEGEALIEFGKQAVKNYASQLLPFGTLANQINKTIDPTVKDTYSSNKIEKEVKKAISKYPGLSQMLPQGVDTVGEGKVYNEGQDLGTQIFNNFFNPSTMSYYNPSDVEANALDMYYETGDTIQAPSYHSGKITNKGNTYNLTDEEMREYSKRIARALRYAKKTPEGYFNAMDKEKEKFRKDLIKKHNIK